MWTQSTGGVRHGGFLPFLYLKDDSIVVVWTQFRVVNSKETTDVHVLVGRPGV